MDFSQNSLINDELPSLENETNNNNINIIDEQKNANVTNCLALTIQEDHKLIALKNVFLKTVRMSWKVAITSITLELIRLFL